MDGVLHMLAFGVQLRTLETGNTQAKVFPADARKADKIKQLIETGELFCHWQRLNYPYD